MSGCATITRGTSEPVVCKGRNQDARDNWRRLSEACGEDEREQLGLVADIGGGDDPGRDEEGFHNRSAAGLCMANWYSGGYG